MKRTAAALCAEVAQVEAQAAWERGDTAEAQRYQAMARRASEAAGEDACRRAWRYITGEELRI